MQESQRIRTTGALLGAHGVAAAAFGAHGLQQIATPEQMRWWALAAALQLLTAPLIVVVGASPGTFRRVAGDVLTVGVISFCGSLYAMTFGAPRWFGAITPLGGLALIVGWILLAWAPRSSR